MERSVEAVAGMHRWEHRTVLITRDGDRWSVQFAEGESLDGLERILDEYGAKGWELASFVPHSWTTRAGYYGPYEVDAYRAVFKRRVAAP
ncbi:MAG: DUF4177 domain-containing protein [Chloroflexota bacterium]|nr:DUF4177 domain-containing protein [Chloroflexota bacterium]